MEIVELLKILTFPMKLIGNQYEMLTTLTVRG